MQQGCFTKKYDVMPDLCDAEGNISPLGVFTIFQGLAAQHAELIGVGSAAMAARGEFWLTVHNRVDFFAKAKLLDELTASTWPERCDVRAYRTFRSGSLYRGDQLIALGRTQWAILGNGGKLMQFGQSGFPADFQFADISGITATPTRFVDDFTQEDYSHTYTVRSTDIDLGHHMNNVAYIRAIMDCFPATVIAEGNIASIEVHYSAQSMENEPLSVYVKNEDPVHRIALKKDDGKPAVLCLIRFRE